MHLIPSVLPSHSGTYSCVAENVLGQVTDHADAEVEDADFDDGGDDDDDGNGGGYDDNDGDDDDIDKMATHLILGPWTGDTDEIGFPSRQKNEIAKNIFLPQTRLLIF